MTSRTVTVMWETDAASPGTVEYGTTPSLGSSVSGPSVTLHEIRLTGLAEHSTYYYRVVSGPDISAQYTFKTFSLSATSFRFAVFGDSRDNPAEVVTLAGHVDSLSPRPVLPIHTGDIVADGDNYGEWGPLWFTPQHPLMARLPLYTVLGNHHDHHELHVGVPRGVGDEDDRPRHVLHVRRRLDRDRAVGLTDAPLHPPSHRGLGVADVDRAARDVVLPTVERGRLRPVPPCFVAV